MFEVIGVDTTENEPHEGCSLFRWGSTRAGPYALGKRVARIMKDFNTVSRALFTF